jgi:hypothetical protein
MSDTEFASSVFKYALWGCALSRGNYHPITGDLSTILERGFIDETTNTYQSAFTKATKGIRRDGLDRLIIHMLRNATYDDNGLPVFDNKKASDSAHRCAKLVSQRFEKELRKRTVNDSKVFESFIIPDFTDCTTAVITSTNHDMTVETMLEVGRQIRHQVETEQSSRPHRSYIDVIYDLIIYHFF